MSYLHKDQKIMLLLANKINNFHLYFCHARQFKSSHNSNKAFGGVGGGRG